MYAGSYSVLPTGESMNPAHPNGATYVHGDETAYVLFKMNEARTRPTRVLTSYGHVGIKIGDAISLRHDQTMTYLGEYEVVGIVDFPSGESAGEIPDMKLKHCVMK